MKLAVIRIRGVVGIDKGKRDTLKMLGLHKTNCCAVLEGTPSKEGMLRKLKDFVTWGEINDETLSLLSGGKKGAIVRLSPPLRGFERKGIKKPFEKGGALGYRGDAINILIKKMLR